MTIPHWLPIVATLAGGGAMGAIINSLVANYRNKVQPIYCSKEYTSVFNHSFLGLSKINSDLGVSAEVTISEINGNTNYSYENLSVIKLRLVNIGNKDMDEFKFGATLGEEDRVLYIDEKSSDRYHKIEVLTPTTFLKPKREIDFVLKPFNRKDEYNINLFVFSRDNKSIPDEIQISTPHPVKIASTRPLNTAAKIAFEIAWKIAGIPKF